MVTFTKEVEFDRVITTQILGTMMNLFLWLDGNKVYIIYKSSSPCLTLVYSPYMVHAWVWRHYELIYDINMIILTLSHDYWIYQFKNTWWCTYLMKYRIIIFHVLTVNHKRGRERISHSNYVTLSSITWLIYYTYSLFCTYKISSFRLV